MNKTLEKILEDEIFSNENFEGEGSLEIQDTSEGTKLGIQILGNSKQEQSKASKNILDLTKLNKSVAFANVDTLRENELIISAINNTESITRYASFSIDLAPGTYYISSKINILAGSGGTTFLQVSTGTFEKRIYADVSKQSIILEQQTKILLNFIISEKNVGTPITEDKKVSFSDIMIAKEDIPYEPFIPQKPSINYTSENQSCGDNKQIKVSILNKNYLHFNQNLDNTVNGLHIIIKKGTNKVKLEGTLNKATGLSILPYLDIEKLNKLILNKKIVVQVDNLKIENDVSLPELNISTASNIYLGQLKNNQLSATMEVKEPITNIFFYFYNNTEINTEISFQFEENSKSEIVDSKTQDISISVQKPFRVIGKNRDIFIFQNDKWQESHIIKRIESYSNEQIKTDYVSNTGELSEGAVVDYILDKPELIECTEEQTKALNKLMQATAYDKITNIICTDEVPCNFKVNAKISKIKKLIGGK